MSRNCGETSTRSTTASSPAWRPTRDCVSSGSGSQEHKRLERRAPVDNQGPRADDRASLALEAETRAQDIEFWDFGPGIVPGPGLPRVVGCPDDRIRALAIVPDLPIGPVHREA